MWAEPVDFGFSQTGRVRTGDNDKDKADYQINATDYTLRVKKTNC